MGIIAAMPFPMEKGGEIFLSKEPGFHVINQTLKELAGKTAAGQPDMICVDAIPSCMAHLKKIHSDMDNEGLEECYDEEHWRKAMVIYILRKYRAYDIAIDTITEQRCNPRVWSIFGRKLAMETGMENCIYMLQFQGEDVALFDRKGYLLPIAQFPESVEREFGENCIKSLEDYEKDILLSFLLGLLEKTIEYKVYIKSFIKDLEADGAKTVGQWSAGKDCLQGMGDMPVLGSEQAHKYFQGVPSFPVELPNVFHSELVLAGTELLDGSIRGFGKECTFQFKTHTSEGNLYFSGFLPLSEEMVDFLENNHNIYLESVDVNDEKFEEMGQILVKLSFIINKQKIVLAKNYDQKNISYANSVPMISIFPYVDLPKECWRSYYLSLIRNETGSTGEVEFLKRFKEIEGKDIDLAEVSLSSATEAERKEDRQSWYYSCMDHIPKFVKLCEADFEKGDNERNITKEGKYLGCICVGTPHITRSKEDRTYVWALDMGTRNTIAAYKEKGIESIFHRLSRDQIYCSLLFGMGDNDRNFARECYAPIQEVEGSFPTMVRTYKQGRQNGGEKCYEHGCALFPDLELIEMLLRRDSNWSAAAIMTDIKFGRKDAEHQRALQIFLFNMLWLGSLECILNGAGTLEVRISYPRTDIQERMEKTWNRVKSMMGEVSNIAIRYSYCSEAEANARYLQKEMKNNPVLAISTADIFGICDIGDGTSDFNLYLGTSEDNRIPDRIQFSMRYAGGDILVDTIMNFSEKWQRYFPRLWDMPEESDRMSQDSKYKIAKNLLNKYSQLLLLRKGYGGTGSSNELKDGNGKMAGQDIEKIRADVQTSRRSVVLTLIENVGLKRSLILSPDEPIKDFIVVLTFKYWNLFHVYGEMLKKFAPKELVSFKLFLYGGGRKALEFVTGESLDEFAETKFGKDILSYLSSQAGVDEAGFSMYLGEDKNQKKEVVEGMLEEIGDDTIESRVYSSSEEIDGYYLKGHETQLPGNDMSIKQMESLLEGYQKYIQSVEGKQYFDLYVEGKGKNVYEAISVGEYGIIDSQLEEENYKLFRKSAQKFWHEVTADKDNPKCLWEVLFYTKMSNFLLTENILQV